MTPASWVNGARRSAGLSQRGLAARSGVPQPMIARIETARQTPRVDTLERLLRACGWELEMIPRRGTNVDRAEVRAWLKLSPAERLERSRAVAQLAKAFGIESESKTVAEVLGLVQDSLREKAEHAGPPTP